jgi:hypothetical protein
MKPFNLGHAALSLSRELRAPIFPVVERAKTPATRRGFLCASSDPRRIRAWWAAGAFNIGLPTGATSGIVVVDVDDDKGGSEHLAALLTVAPTRSAKTGNGFHYYFAAPATDLRSRVGFLPGVDLRAAGAYVVAPPSVHPSGRSYEWLSTAPLAPFPEELLAHLVRSAPFITRAPRSSASHGPAVARARAYVRSMPPAVSGQRGHDTTFRVAIALVRGFALSNAEALPILEEFNARCVPPWSERELEHKLHDAARSDRLQLGYLL